MQSTIDVGPKTRLPSSLPYANYVNTIGQLQLQALNLYLVVTDISVDLDLHLNTSGSDKHTSVLVIKKNKLSKQ